jgi:hypothetical protein
VLKLHGITRRYTHYLGDEYRELVREAIMSCEKILGISALTDNTSYNWKLNWPMKVLIAEKEK